MYCGQLHPRLFTKGHVRTQNWNDSTTRLKAHNRMTTSQNDIHTLKVTYQQSALSHTEGLHTRSSSWSQLCHWLLRQYPSQTPMGTRKCCCFEGQFSRTSIQTDFTQKDIRTQWPSLKFYLHPSWIPFAVGQFCYASTLLSCLNIMKLCSAVFWLTLRLLMASLSMPTTSWPSQSVALKPLVQLTNLPYKTYAGWKKDSPLLSPG